MHQTRNAAIVLTAALVAGCDQHDSTDELSQLAVPARTAPQDPGVVSTQAQPKQEGNSWGAIFDEGMKVAEEVAQDTAVIGEEALEVAKEAGQVVVDGAYVAFDVVDNLEAMSDQALARAGLDPKMRKAIIGFSKNRLPLLKDTDRYRKARVAYATGRETTDAEMIQQARRDCLRSCINLGLDIGTLGSSGLIDATLEGADQGFSIVEKTKLASDITGIEEINQLNKGLDAILVYRSVSYAMDYLLTVDMPAKSSDRAVNK